MKQVGIIGKRNRTNASIVDLFFDTRENGQRRTRLTGISCDCGCKTRDCNHWKQALALASGVAVGPLPERNGSNDRIYAHWEQAVRHLSPYTVSVYRIAQSHFRRWLGGRDIPTDPYAILDFRKWLGAANGFGSGTCTCYITAIKALYNRAKRAGLIDRTPWTDIEPSLARQLIVPVENRKAILTADEVERLLAVSTREGMIFKLFYYTGFRLGELINLRWADVADTQFKIRPHPDGWKPKWNVPRQIPINDALRPVLDALRAKADGKPYVVTAVAHVEHVCERYVRDAIGGLYKKHGVVGSLPDDESVGVHTIRHTFASRLVNERKCPLPVAMKLLGHKHLSTTEKYLHPTQSAETDAINSL